MDPITTALLAVAVFVFMLYRQFVQRPVTTRDLLLPILGGLYLGYRYLNGAGLAVDVLVIGGAILGVVTGLVSGVAVRVWQDSTTGQVLQRGGWTYLVILLALVAVRVLLHVVMTVAMPSLDATALNNAFIGMAVGNYAGRAITVGLRALALVGWDPGALPRDAGRRQSRSW